MLVHRYFIGFLLIVTILAVSLGQPTYPQNQPLLGIALFLLLIGFAVVERLEKIIKILNKINENSERQHL